MEERPPPEIARLQKTLGPYIRPRQDALNIRRVLALHLNHVYQPETHRDGDSRPLALQRIDDHVKSSSSRGLRKDYVKSLRANNKARQDYESICSRTLDQAHAAKAKDQFPASDQDIGNPLLNYVLLLKQQTRLKKLQVVTRYLDLLDQKPPSSSDFLDYKTISDGIEPLPPVPTEVLREEKVVDAGSSVKTITELVHQLEKAVLMARSQLDSEKRQTLACKSRLAALETPSSEGDARQRLEALGKTRNYMISWMEEQLAQTGDSSGEEEAGSQNNSIPKVSTEAQLNLIQKEYRKYLIAREKLLVTLKMQERSLESANHSEATEKPRISEAIPETQKEIDSVHPQIIELLSISREQKSQIMQRSYLNTCLAKQQREATQSLDRLAEESHLLPLYQMANSRSKRAERPESFSGMLAGVERPDFIGRAKGWVSAAEAAQKATRDAVLEKVEEGRAAIDESLHTLLGLHQLLGYDMEDMPEDENEEDIWGAGHESAEKESAVEGEEDARRRRDIWSRVDGNLGVIRRDND